jgi:hypothetical protein
MHRRGGNHRTLATSRPAVLAGTTATGTTGAGAATGATRTTWAATLSTLSTFTGAAPTGTASSTGTAASRAASAGTSARTITTMATPAGPAVAAVVTIFVTPAAALAGAGGQDHRHVRRPLGRPDHLDAPGLLRRPGRLDRAERDHLDAFQSGLDLGPEYGTDLLVGGDQGRLDDAFGLARASGAPRP